MQVSIIFIALFNIIDISLISFFGSRLITRSFENFKSEYQIRKSEEEYRRYGSFDVFMDNLNFIRRKFWISFYTLEFALIAYFLFWGILLYNHATII